ncbi:AAT family amino acid transporter [Exophiala aquamarina CBS 119918]|uniref:AAT family amino acid transporter n=1 Tax=Exophiala aquamarina CBS 119918 TaxID=1182545 RepID=A0A072PFW9_9EURO|nr:AAT family amino acid transporter [Exophiala aquamarina CBS 119918]KEF58657.1 AAT family amino acid transporter [Exophiala aquamarina CBS 119918]
MSDPPQHTNDASHREDFVEKDKKPAPHYEHKDLPPVAQNDPKMQKLAREITYADHIEPVNRQHNPLAQKLKSRHLQMIAIGGSIGAGLFVGSGGALRSGGPASVLLGFMIVGGMLLCTMQALGELTVLYPVNGAFYTYICRFVDPSWGFAVGWDYALGWLTVLPSNLRLLQ